METQDNRIDINELSDEQVFDILHQLTTLPGKINIKKSIINRIKTRSQGLRESHYLLLDLKTSFDKIARQINFLENNAGEKTINALSGKRKVVEA